MTTNDYGIPQYMMDGLIRYIHHGEVPGGFLLAVLENNLKEAVAQADSTNIELLPAYVRYPYNRAPAPCWGSPERVKEWVEYIKVNTIVGGKLV